MLVPKMHAKASLGANNVLAKPIHQFVPNMKIRQTRRKYADAPMRRLETIDQMCSRGVARGHRTCTAVRLM